MTAARMRSWVGAGAAAAVAAAVAAGAPFGIDYLPAPNPFDSARAQIDALARLDLGAFARNQAPQGPVSAIVRAPFAALASAGDQLSRYRLGVFACMLALALVGVAAAAVMRRRGSPLWHCALVTLVVLFEPAVHQAIVWGHPEELLATAFVVTAAGAAASGRPRAAAVIAGVAVATKPWALMAVPAIALVAGPSWRCAGRFGASALAVGALLVAPVAIADTSAFRTAARDGNTIYAVLPMDVWWFSSDRHVTVDRGGGDVTRVRRPKLAHVVEKTIRPLIVALAFALPLLLLRRQRRVSAAEVFALLALVLLLRCLLDPHDQSYYHVAFITAAALADGLERRPPLIALVATVMLSRPALRAMNGDEDALAVEYLAWSVPVALLLATRLLRGRVGPARDHDVAPAAGVSPRHARG